MNPFVFSPHALARMEQPERRCDKFGVVAAILHGERGTDKYGNRTATLTDAAINSSPLAADPAFAALRGIHVVYNRGYIITVWRRPDPTKTLAMDYELARNDFACSLGRRQLRQCAYISSFCE